MGPDVTTSHHDGVLGRIRTRSVGRPDPAVPEVVLVQGLAVADYLMPALRVLGGWTRAHLIELPGMGGSGDPPHRLSVAEYGSAVADWLTASGIGAVVLAGHSSGTQVAAEAAGGHPDVAGVVLAGPTMDPAVRNPVRLMVQWFRDGRREGSGLVRTQIPEWRRAGAGQLIHLVRVHLRHDLAEPVARLTVPLLIVRGREDPLSTPVWCRRLVALAPGGQYVEVAGAHSFPWTYPHAWSPPIHRFAAGLPHT